MAFRKFFGLGPKATRPAPAPKELKYGSIVKISPSVARDDRRNLMPLDSNIEGHVYSRYNIPRGDGYVPGFGVHVPGGDPLTSGYSADELVVVGNDPEKIFKSYRPRYTGYNGPDVPESHRYTNPPPANEPGPPASMAAMPRAEPPPPPPPPGRMAPMIPNKLGGKKHKRRHTKRHRRNRRTRRR